MSEKRIFLYLALFLFPFAHPVVFAQEPVPVPVEISSQKVVAEGKVWFMHRVVKGQTLYSISRAYGVTVNDITVANNITANGIRDGQILKIPAVVLQQGQQKGTPVQQKEGSASQKETPVQQKETPVRQNETPVRQNETPGQQQDDRFIRHLVGKGETLSSLSRQYGVSVRELKKANKGLFYPREGEYLLIPRQKIRENKIQRPERVTDTVKPVLQVDRDSTESKTGILADAVDTSVIKELRGSLRVEVLLPFYLPENSVRRTVDSSRVDSNGKKIYREAIKQEDWIYDASLPFIEMYEGMLIAVDSLRSLGLEVELNVSDTGADTSTVDRLISSGRLSNADLIIGPVYSYNLERIATYAATYGIPVVSPVQLRNQNILEGRPNLFRVCPSARVAQDVIVREVAAHQGSNVIFLYSDSLMIDPQTAGFWGKIRTALTAETDAGTTLLTEHYYTGVVPRYDMYRGVATLETMMKADRENIIILATVLSPKVSAALSTLHTLSRRYDIIVLGYPELGTLETIDLRYYYDLQMMIPSESYIDYTRESTRAFLDTFRKKFRTEPPAESFAWRGFDMAYYFIGGLALEGKAFLQSPGSFNPSLVSHDFGFRRDSTGDGFDNWNMFLLQYKKDMSVSVKLQEDTAVISSDIFNR